MKIFSILFVVIAATLTGCASTSSTSAGYAFLYNNTVDPIVATSSAGTSKKGTACAHNILGLVAFGDASIDNAKKEGSIKVISSVDRDAFRILGFYGKSCTIVNGE